MRLEKAERETIILINEADVAEGFFKLSTTQQTVAKKVVEIIGKSKENVNYMSHRGHSFHFRIPIAFLSPSFGLRAKRSAPKKKPASKATLNKEATN